MTPGSFIAHYRIASKLGEGGMGEVWRAADTRLGRDVAIKVLPAALSGDTQYMARFEREPQTLAALNHPNIAAIYGIEQGAIVMELVEGETLPCPVPVATAPSTTPARSPTDWKRRMKRASSTSISSPPTSG